MKLQGCREQLMADTVLKMASGVLEFDTVQKVEVLNDSGTCIHKTTWLHFGCLNHSYSILSFKWLYICHMDMYIHIME